MNATEARVALLKESVVLYEDKRYIVTAIVHRRDYRYEPTAVHTFVTLEEEETGLDLLEESGPSTGCPKEVPIEEITI